ncbi:LEAF RUST 10 DISEASE-RESISTANCE LOCUS RECEPTOR-LIKE PROTEIN KINASE-like 2.5 [Chenopodium quinoa]|uniref:LEAF RUST 10 DISEASE-RESISTANCE LOCUS RECEPTOR-LIKE PROTEIN KINASE-like 2.5 n=1 Tax=Chenopodium quinoa TaxID=63459 RepID=UPI000B77ED0C|nr:LEAF RUST 10 DISEASE-RESISTANCE LOCUS RECEPTOR-LIKE PROTEIN KINASE-like 2.5 [Chenopodium quinoa]
MSLAAITLFSLLSQLVLLITCTADEQKGHLCPSSFQCGTHGSFSYPFTTAFYPDCGILVINCTDSYQTIGLSPNGPWYGFVNTFPTKTSVLATDYLQQTSYTCIQFEGEPISLPKSSTFVFTILTNETFWKCRRNFSMSGTGRQSSRVLVCQDYIIYKSYGYSDDGNEFSSCDDFQYPEYLMLELSDKCSQCISEGGQCQELKNDNSQCIRKRKGKRLQLILGLVATASSLGVILIVSIIMCAKRRRASKGFKILGNKTTTRNRNVEAFLKSYGSLAPKRYTYSEITKMTNNFEVKLGEGGYGAVFKGRLHDGHDGRFVAVKNLKSLRGDGEEFINEVVSIGRTNHVNVVTLLGFCFEGDKRALVYEFLPNGSLEKFIYDAASCQSLPSKTLYSILVGIAKGLDYLHRGCNARILHFDIKPHNILLDEEFCPKISDFGLARLCPAKDSLVSMSEARGTIGYIAPEVFCRNNFGGVSNKSDVYSYGMMILDLVCGRRNVIAEAQQGSEMYFPEWIYRQLDLEVHGIMNGEEKELKRKMILVGLWCIQSYPSNRPPMDKVIEMLEGSLESIQVPPMPHLSSIPNSVINSTFSTTY